MMELDLNSVRLGPEATSFFLVSLFRGMDKEPPYILPSSSAPGWTECGFMNTPNDEI